MITKTEGRTPTITEGEALLLIERAAWELRSARELLIHDRRDEGVLTAGPTAIEVVGIPVGRARKWLEELEARLKPDTQ